MNVTLGVGIDLRIASPDLPADLLRVLSPRFLMRHSRYAILVIVILAAVITPTPDVFNLMLFAIPMMHFVFVGSIRELLAGATPRRKAIPVEADYSGLY